MDAPSLTPANRESLWGLMTALFPIHRTLVNKGYQRSMELIGREIPLRVQKVPSGTKVWDWIVPDAWEVNQAYIEDSRGRRLVDFRQNPLHLAAYSAAFDGTVSREDLLKKLIWSETAPEAIPFGYRYYTNDWRFCVAKTDLGKFTDDKYHVVIDSEKRPGEMWLGESVLPGETDREIVLSTYLCHPSLANDSLSGVVCGVEVFKELARQKRRRYTYRLLIVPETVGCVAYLATHTDWIPKIEGGYLLTTCGDAGEITYKKSYFGDRLVDRAALHVLAQSRGGRPFRVQDFVPIGSDERQFSAPGVRVPFGSFLRTPYAEYREYHTSADDLTFVKPEALLDTVSAVLETLFVIDNNAAYRNTYRAEPFLSRHGLHIPFEKPEDDGYINQIVAHETDGTQDLLAIADKHARPFRKVLEFNERFKKAGLVEEAAPRGGSR